MDKEIMKEMGAEKLKEIMEAMKGDEKIKALDSNKTTFSPKGRSKTSTEGPTRKKYMIEMKNETDLLIETIKMADEKDFDKRHHMAGSCFNDDTTGDRDGDTCSSYYDDNPHNCGCCDTNTFTASVQCCTCGGGYGCPDGYRLLPGDKPGWGDIGSFRVNSLHECTNKCNERHDCRAFEYSPTEKICNLNNRDVANHPKYKDYITCAKGGGVGGGGGAVSFTVSSTGHAAHYQSERMGVYHSTGQTYYNFPVYKKTAGSVQFLFVDSYGYWSVTDHLNPTHSALYHPNSGASSPPVTGWKYVAHDEWYDDHQLTVTQTGGVGGGGDA